MVCCPIVVPGAAASGAGAEVDVSSLPAPATNVIDFARDIRPILQESCLRCHGPEKPKSNFRLDNRAAALKGGDNGVDILPSKSAQSPLIHFVAQLVPDKEMPPEGKGEPLTPAQVALLRAWIDQGAAWDNAASTNSFAMSLSPSGGWTFLKGDNRSFREQFWRREGFEGGLEGFDFYAQPDADTKLSLTGHTLKDDYKIELDVDRNALGFVHSGWTQFRKYYDDSGGYFVTPTPSTNQFPQRLGTDLYLDTGKAWIDLGLTLPHWPRLVFGYEYNYTRGNEATTSWGSDGVRTDPRNIAPTSRYLDETIHIAKFDLDAEILGVTVEDRFRGEFYGLHSGYTNVAARSSISQNVQDHNRYFQGANSFRLERKFADWLFASGGYFYSKLTATDTFTNATVSGRTLFAASVPHIDLERESDMFNLNALLGPFYGLTLSGGVQDEWTRQQSDGLGRLNGIAYTRPPTSNLAINPAALSSDYDQNTVSYTAGLRFNKIPYTALFADARWQEETIGQTDSDIQPTTSFVENPSFSSRLTDYRAGFSTSPWQAVALSAHYRRYEDDSYYRTNQLLQPVGGYPGDISWREMLSDEVEAKLVLHARSWLKTTLSYQYVKTDFKEETRPAFDLVPPVTYSSGGYLLAGQSESHIFSVGETLIPHRRLFLTGVVSYEENVTRTAGQPLVPAYKGNIYSLLASGTYILSDSTDLSVNYTLSMADYTQPDLPFNASSPPPLGLRYHQHALQAALSHRVSKNLTTRLQYGYYYYGEPTSGYANNYRAQALFATVTYHIP